MEKKTFTVIVKVTGNYCNLRCGYCFYSKNDQQEPTVMSLELAEKLIKQFLETGQAVCSFIWHGGEPMLAGQDFFEKILEFQKKYALPDQKVRNGIQTNATVVTDEWAKFFKINDFGVGISLDGCKSSHNKFRVRADGEGSFDDVMRGVKILKANDVRLGYIQTVSRDNLLDLEENFRFFTEEIGAKSWGMNYYLNQDETETSAQSVTSDEKADHVIRCIDLWLKRDDENLKIREIESYFRPFLHSNADDCHFGGTCGSFICINWNGEVYPCDRFSNMKEFILGNLNVQNISEILHGEILTSHARRVHTLPVKCRKCEWLSNCHNGCAHNRTPDVSGIYYYCEAREKIFTHVKQIAKSYGI